MSKSDENAPICESWYCEHAKGEYMTMDLRPKAGLAWIYAPSVCVGPATLRSIATRALEMAGLIEGRRTDVKTQSGTIRTTYTNYRGNRRERHLEPLGVRYGATEWHPEPGVLIKCRDLETGEIREFSGDFEDLEGVLRLAVGAGGDE